jgi:hypothetical protein
MKSSPQLRTRLAAGLSGYVVLLALAQVAAAQATGDSRTVTEPAFPAACSTLTATKTISSNEPSSETLDTTAIQNALNACASGKAVELVAGSGNNAFVMGPITIPSGVTLLVDGGVTVFASRNPADYQIGTPSSTQDTCGTDGPNGNGCNNLITVGASTGSGLMGYGVIEGRGWDPLLVGGVAQIYSWWDLARAAGSGNSQNNFIMLQASKASSFTLYKITLRNPAMFHVKYNGTASGFTVWGLKIITPYFARNTDGIDPGDSVTNVTITHSSLSDGDDNVAMGSAHGQSGNMSVTYDNTYSGHGVSIGSYTNGGLSNVLVDHVNQYGTAVDSNATGLRIKSAADRGGLVQNITYSNLCMENESYAIVINPTYNTNTGTEYPQFSNILYQNVHVLSPGSVNGKLQLDGLSNEIATITFNNLVFDTLNTSQVTPAPSYATITLAGPTYPALLSNLQSISGSTSLTYNGSANTTNASAYACASSNFPLLVGEMYLNTTSATNLQSATIADTATVTLNAMLQPAMSQVSFTYASGYGTGSYTGNPAPTASVNFMEGSTVVGTAALSGNGTLASVTLSGVTPGTHIYTAQYPGDTNYSALSFGSTTVTVTAGSATKLAFTSAPPSSLVYGNAAGTVVVGIEDSAGNVVSSSALVTLTVTATGYTHTYTATASAGVATFNVSAITGVGTYTYTAAATSLTSATASSAVSQALLTVTAQNASRTYGQVNPALSYVISGYVNGDSASVVSGSPVLSTTAKMASAVGAYTINVALGTLTAVNYTFAGSSGTLTVNGGAAQSILFFKLPNLSHGSTYALSARTTSGLPVSYSVTGPGTISGSKLTVTGTGVVTVTAAQNGNSTFAVATSVPQSFTAQ